MKQHSPEQLKELKSAARSMYQAMLTLDSPTEVRQFLLDLCTPAELEAMVDRWWVANLLTEGRDRKSTRLNSSHSSVSRMPSSA